MAFWTLFKSSPCRTGIRNKRRNRGYWDLAVVLQPFLAVSFINPHRELPVGTQPWGHGRLPHDSAIMLRHGRGLSSAACMYAAAGAPYGMQWRAGCGQEHGRSRPAGGSCPHMADNGLRPQTTAFTWASGGAAEKPHLFPQALLSSPSFRYI